MKANVVFHGDAALNDLGGGVSRRVLAYTADGAVRSKREGGEWALERLPQYRPVIQAALDDYKKRKEAE